MRNCYWSLKVTYWRVVLCICKLELCILYVGRAKASRNPTYHGTQKS